MKWVAGYLIGAMVLITPAGIRILSRSDSLPKNVEMAAAQVGGVLFNHKWTVNDPLSPKGDGVGPVFNASSCVECHIKGGVGGSGGLEHNVTVFVKPSVNGRAGESGVIHSAAIAPRFQESLRHASPELPDIVNPQLHQVRQFTGHGGTPVQISQRNTPALFGANLINSLSDDVIIAQERSQKLRWHELTGVTESLPVGRALHLAKGGIGKFGWKGQNPTLFQFVQAACANELGLSNPGQDQARPLPVPSYVSPKYDLTTEQCEQMTAFISSLPRPVERATDKNRNAHGRQLFSNIGCAECHVPNMGPVEGVYSDLLMHRMGQDLLGGGSYNAPSEETPDSFGDTPLADEWRTPPLWGVGDSAPYMHDGRSTTLPEAIQAHGGQGNDARNMFNRLNPQEQQAVLDFLGSLRAPG